MVELSLCALLSLNCNKNSHLIWQHSDKIRHIVIFRKTCLFQANIKICGKEIGITTKVCCHKRKNLWKPSLLDLMHLFHLIKFYKIRMNFISFHFDVFVKDLIEFDTVYTSRVTLFLFIYKKIFQRHDFCLIF